MKRIQRFSSGPGLADGRICFRVTSVCPGFTKYLHEIKKARQDQEENRRQAALSAALEARKPFLARQQEVYIDLVQTTAILGNNYTNTPRWQKAYKHFWELYWGEITMFADKEVGVALDAFTDTIYQIDNIEGVAVRNASMDLGRLCRDSLASAWKTQLELPPRTTKNKGAPKNDELSHPDATVDPGSEP
jgi:hypothetical protein